MKLIAAFVLLLPLLANAQILVPALPRTPPLSTRTSTPPSLFRQWWEAALVREDRIKELEAEIAALKAQPPAAGIGNFARVEFLWDRPANTLGPVSVGHWHLVPETQAQWDAAVQAELAWQNQPLPEPTQPVPMGFEARSFVSFEDAQGSPGVSGAGVIGFWSAGDALRYRIVAPHAFKTLRMMWGSPADGARVIVRVDGTVAAEFDVPNTGSYSIFAPVEVAVRIDPGEHVLEIFGRTASSTGSVGDLASQITLLP